MTDEIESLIRTVGQQARLAATQIAAAETGQKNLALEKIAEAVDQSRQTILAANAKDLELARSNSLADALYDRLELNEARVDAMISGLRQVAQLADPVGQLGEQKYQPSGLLIGKMRVPLGVIGIIYESRPNVTVDTAALCIKSGNAAILRGGSEAIESNRAIAECVRKGLVAADLSANTVQLINTTDRAAVGGLIQADEFVDVIVPRGGKSLVARIASEARVPVIKHLDGVCHVYVDSKADLNKAAAISINSKTYRYGICGAMETLLVSSDVANDFLPMVKEGFSEHSVELRGCARSCEILPGIAKAVEDDWYAEYLAPVLAVKVVAGLEEAISHISTYGSAHTDAIITEDLQNARMFQRLVDSSSVMLNASTCFADGFQYGLGAEIGISTDKLHVRGPVGLEGLTTEKYLVTGEGTIRQ